MSLVSRWLRAYGLMTALFATRVLAIGTKRLSLRNRWVGHLMCFALGAVLCVAAWAGVGAWRDRALSARLSDRWTLEAAHTDPDVARVNVEYRPDGMFTTWHVRRDGSTRIFEHGRWWVSGGRLIQELAWTDGRSVPSIPAVRPAQLVVVRADQTLVLVWPAGHLSQFRRAG